MGRVRLGVVMLLPPPWDREIQGLRRALGDTWSERVPPHITLVPPVNVRSEDEVRAHELMREAAAETEPFEVIVGPAADFLPDSSTVYLEVGGPTTTRLLALRDRVFQVPLERALTYEYVPHVTLADGIDPERVRAAVRAFEAFRTTIVLDRMQLMVEERTEDWRWNVRAEFVFAKPSVVARGGLELELTITTDVAAGLSQGDPDAVLITARRAGEDVGSLRGRVSNSSGLVADVKVGEPHRRQGIGAHLLAAFESELRRRAPPPSTRGRAARIPSSSSGTAISRLQAPCSL